MLLAGLMLLALVPLLKPVFFQSAGAVAGYLSFHTLLEMVSLVVSMLVFSVGWNAHRQILSGNIVVLACMFFAVGWLDFFHTVSYTGMPSFITQNDWEKHLNYWLPARLLAALALLIVAIRPWQPFRRDVTRYVLLVAMVGFVAVINWLVLAHQNLLPTWFVPGKGLTQTKRGVEYLTIVINLASALVFGWRMRSPQPYNVTLLLAASCVMAMGEFFFTLYTTMTGAYNVLGHVYKSISYLIIYRAIVVEAIEDPYKRFMESQADLALALRSSKTGLWTLDLPTQELTLSPEVKTQLGDDHDELLDGLSTFRELLHPDDRDFPAQLLANLRPVDAHHAEFEGEYRLLHRDGTYRWFLTRGKAVLEPSGRVNRMLGASIDISERRQAEERFRCAFEAAPNAMLMVDDKGHIVLANQQTGTMFGYSDAELIKQPIEILIPVNRRDVHATHVRNFSSQATGRRMAPDMLLTGLARNGQEIPVEVGLNPLATSEGRFVIASVVDIRERLLATRAIERLVNFDQLTGLPNRVLLKDRVEQALKTAGREGHGLAVLFMDLDHFKNVNDTMGHRIGDQLLAAVGQKIKSALRGADTVARIGGDEFVIVLSHVCAPEAALVAEKLLHLLDDSILIDRNDLRVTPSIGIAMYPDDGRDFDTLYQRSDTAMYQAKQDGRNTYRFFTQAMQDLALRMHTLESELRLAIGRHQLSLHYQPQLDIASGKVVGLEALIRWKHPALGQVSPAEFIPIAENCGLIVEIGQWVIQTAVSQLRTWRQQGMTPLQVAVNLSAVQIGQKDLIDMIVRTMDAADVPASSLALEITESVAMKDPARAVKVIDELHCRGFGISLDDFGTGYSSLSYLHQFKLDTLKIDQSFIRNIEHEGAIVGAIIEMASSLGFETIAEGVETQAQLDLLRQRGCTAIQGYLFCRPLPADQIAEFLRRAFENAPA